MKNLLWISALLVALICGCAAEESTYSKSDVDRDVEPNTATTSDAPGTNVSARKPTTTDEIYEFAPPVRLLAGDEPISVEAPGYACPTIADVDGDGKQDLVVGQFSGGSMQLFKNIAEINEPPRFTDAGWIKSDGNRAKVPGVW